MLDDRSDFVEVPLGDQTAQFDQVDYLRLVQETGDEMPVKAYIKRRGYGPRPYVRVRGRTMPASRWVLGMAPGDPRHVHHIDAQTGNNRRCNLVALHPSDHGHQHRPSGRTGYRAVYRMASGRFRARFSGIHVGCYPTERLAALAYDALATRFMSQPQLNIPGGGTSEETRLVDTGFGPTAWLWMHHGRK